MKRARAKLNQLLSFLQEISTHFIQTACPLVLGLPWHACAVVKIRETFPSEDAEYRGFIDI